MHTGGRKPVRQRPGEARSPVPPRPAPSERAPVPERALIEPRGVRDTGPPAHRPTPLCTHAPSPTMEPATRARSPGGNHWNPKGRKADLEGTVPEAQKAEQEGAVLGAAARLVRRFGGKAEGTGSLRWLTLDFT
jgi:hypothetical protein